MLGVFDACGRNDPEAAKYRGLTVLAHLDDVRIFTTNPESADTVKQIADLEQDDLGLTPLSEAA
jgi:hypothetical protein